MLPNLVELLNERGYRWARRLVRREAFVKVGLLNLHFIAKQRPYACERGIFVDFNCMISEWVWRPFGGRSREYEAKQNCASGEQDGESHIQHELRAGPRPRTCAVIDGLHLMP
jgi:hypothetical protein